MTDREKIVAIFDDNRECFSDIGKCRYCVVHTRPTAPQIM